MARTMTGAVWTIIRLEDGVVVAVDGVVDVVDVAVDDVVDVTSVGDLDTVDGDHVLLGALCLVDLRMIKEWRQH